jgi:hypothetical protein
VLFLQCGIYQYHVKHSPIRARGSFCALLPLRPQRAV